jgi:HEAT repeat protein
MMRPAAVLVTLTAIGALAAGVYSYVTRGPDGQDDKTLSVAESQQPAARAQRPHEQALATAAEATPETPATEPRDLAEAAPPIRETNPTNIARWIADTQSTDPKMRAAAIAALAEAPKAEAVPALKRVLTVGEPQVDRQIAVRSLHVLALQQDDDDGAIRNVLRDAVYHGDDEGVTDSARAVLEDIETEFALRSPSN